jgi:bifunctional DNA-binding transcriptional regulator/antitoxin component of YhaV-PrlF toxin-antitoxin module
VGDVKSIITSKYQTTISKEVRQYLGIAVKDAIEWRVEKGNVFVYPVKKNVAFLGVLSVYLLSLEF